MNNYVKALILKYINDESDIAQNIKKHFGLTTIHLSEYLHSLEEEKCIEYENMAIKITENGLINIFTHDYTIKPVDQVTYKRLALTEPFVPEDFLKKL